MRISDWSSDGCSSDLASSTIPLETLQRAFQNIYDTMDTIDRFKLEALGNMKQTVTVLTSEVEKSRGYLARAAGVEQNQIGSTSWRVKVRQYVEHSVDAGSFTQKTTPE